jgi:hypothetical protein
MGEIVVARRTNYKQEKRIKEMEKQKKKDAKKERKEQRKKDETEENGLGSEEVE